MQGLFAGEGAFAEFLGQGDENHIHTRIYPIYSWFLQTEQL
jgi:hypothetical protein